MLLALARTSIFNSKLIQHCLYSTSISVYQFDNTRRECLKKKTREILILQLLYRYTQSLTNMFEAVNFYSYRRIVHAV